MKINKIFIYTLVLIHMSTIVACDNYDDIQTNSDNHISLKANITNIEESRVTNGEVITGTQAGGLNAAVWFSNTLGEYPIVETPAAPTYVPCHTTVTYDRNSPTTVYVNPESQENPLSYPITTTNKEIYCTGLYPPTGWSTINSGKGATHTIDGTQDLMFADQISGSWDMTFPTQRVWT